MWMLVWMLVWMLFCGRLRGGPWGHFRLIWGFTVRHTVRQPGRLRGGLWSLLGSWWLLWRTTVEADAL